MHQVTFSSLNPGSTATAKNHGGVAISTLLSLALATMTLGCSSSSSPSQNGHTGGTTRSTGGNTNQGGIPTTSGGSISGGAGSGGTSAGGALSPTMGGASTGGARTGGISTGGTTPGGASAGGASAGGASGTSAGGARSGGASAGGATGGTTGSVVSGNCVATPLTELVGWAAESGLGVNSTTGGGNTSPVVATDLAQLNGYLKGVTPQVIHLKGKITGNVVMDDTANKTIIGCGGHLVGNVMMENTNNIILQNLTVSSPNPDAKDDLITIDNQTHHVWLDHLELADGGDGNLDIVHGSDYITVSWIKFIYHQLPAATPGDSLPGGHQFACLIGHDNKNAAEDTGHLKVTFHHNWWADNIKERMPRIRFGQVHLFNNLYAASGGYTTTYAIRVGWSANVRSEQNIFKGINNPFDFGDSNPEAKVESIGDVLTDCTGTTDVTGKGPAFKPPYAYTPDPIETLESKIRAGAGPR